MNLRSLINYHHALNMAIGISVDTTQADQLVYSFCILQRKNSMISIYKMQDEIRSKEVLQRELGELIQRGVRVHLNFIGKTILHKPITESNGTISQLVQQTFPFLQPHEIVAQVNHNGGETFLSVIRKSVVADCESLFAIENTWCAITLGTFGVQQLGAFIKDQVVHLDGFEITFSKGNTTYRIGTSSRAMNDVNTEVLLGNEKVKLCYLPAYAAAFQVFVPFDKLTDSGYVLLEKGRQQISRNQQYYQFGRTALFVVLVILLVNAGVYSWLKVETNNLHQTVETVADENDAKRAEFTRNQQLDQIFQQLGWTTNQLPLYYADQIGSTVTPEIRLMELEVGVLDQFVLKQDKKFVFQPVNIRVKGIADTPVALHQWLQSLEKLAWINEIMDQRYQINPRHGKGEFQLTLAVR